MRITVDLPDPLYRKLKARAALEGRSVKELMHSLLRRALAEPAPPPSSSPGRSLPPGVSGLGRRAARGRRPEQRRPVRTARRRTVTVPSRAPRGVLPDMNAWLALSVSEHVHHPTALAWWQHGAAPACHFNRVTMLGLVRLLAQPRVMGRGALDARAALAVWQRWAALPEVALHPDPPGLDAALAALAAPNLPPRRLTDAYLAAFAIRAGLRLVSFDADFARFQGLHWLRLQPTAT